MGRKGRAAFYDLFSTLVFHFLARYPVHITHVVKYVDLTHVVKYSIHNFRRKIQCYQPGVRLSCRAKLDLRLRVRACVIPFAHRAVS